MILHRFRLTYMPSNYLVSKHACYKNKCMKEKATILTGRWIPRKEPLHHIFILGHSQATLQRNNQIQTHKNNNVKSFMSTYEVEYMNQNQSTWEIVSNSNKCTSIKFYLSSVYSRLVKRLICYQESIRNNFFFITNKG